MTVKTAHVMRYPDGTVRRYPVEGATYWAALATVGATGWTTVWGSYHGAYVDPDAAVGSGAALFTTRDGAERYLAAHGPTMAPGAQDQAPVVAPVIYVGGTYYRTATVAPSTTQTDGRKPQRGDVFEVNGHAVGGIYFPSAPLVAHDVVKMNDGTYRVETCRPGSTDTRSMHFYVDRTGRVIDAPAPCGTCRVAVFSVDGVTYDALTGTHHAH